MTGELSRREVRHAILRAHNVRVARWRLEEWPTELHLARGTLDALLVDNDPDELRTLDFEGFEFSGIRLVIDPRLEVGRFTLIWPTPTPQEPPRV